ncbi:hypothetical protein P4S95_10885 [Aneurinibacillus aneurinilyticus]|uniref:hypothetical protein n=1 Tax=Aneurinibacillus aneurinilyticus TaxID=1391 RepID=UPI002E21BE52|nr:hypothetical protein [Aneurinibacillus aneurinilyticus]
MSIQSETLVKLFFGTLIGTATSYIGKNNDLDEADRPNWIDDVITVLFKGLKA